VGKIQTASHPNHRDASLDIARGLIMAFMALDHVRMYFSSAQFDPVDLDHTNLGFFLTRWITHLCAPGFFFIAGVGASLAGARQSKKELATFLFSRGIWLIFLELAVFSIAWSFNPGNWLWIGVIAGLGASMIVLAGLIFLPRMLILVMALAFTLLHNALWDPAWFNQSVDMLLYTVTVAPLPLLGDRLVLFPLLPWGALMALGYATAPWLMPDGKPATGRLAISGAMMLVIFVLIRLAGIGQPENGGFIVGDTAHSFMSFLNVEKYPPSLQFSLVTLGAMALVLAWLAKNEGRPGMGLFAPIQAYGRVPFFFYFVHLFLIHGMALAIATGLGWPTDYLFWEGNMPNLIPPDGYGFGLAGIYLSWLAVLAILYPLCVWFGGVKRGHPDNRLLRLF
jgi:uncharacterized membrane protein